MFKCMFKTPLKPLLVLMLAAFGLASAQTSVQQVQDLRTEARAAYPVGFPDLAPWANALNAAQALVAQQPGLEAQRLLAELYTETHWWAPAWQAWSDYRTQGGRETIAVRQQVGLTARNLRFYAQQRNDEGAASYWQEQATVQTAMN